MNVLAENDYRFQMIHMGICVHQTYILENNTSKFVLHKHLHYCRYVNIGIVAPGPRHPSQLTPKLTRPDGRIPPTSPEIHVFLLAKQNTERFEDGYSHGLPLCIL
jgi:hypothetical protein